MERKQLLKVVVFVALATIISFIFRAFEIHWLEIVRLPYGTYYGMSLLVGIGPLFSAIICKRLFNEKRSFLSFWGESKIKSIIFLLIPILTVIYIGVINKESINAHLFAFKVCFMWLLYIIGEELGWRGYLQEVLIPKGNDYKRAFIIGLVWYLWHLSFFYVAYSLIKEVFFVIVLIFGSFIILKVTETTKSLSTAIALHFSFSVLTNIKLPENSHIPILIMCFCWGILSVFWNRGFLKRI